VSEQPAKQKERSGWARFLNGELVDVPHAGWGLKVNGEAVEIDPSDCVSALILTRRLRLEGHEVCLVSPGKVEMPFKDPRLPSEQP